MTIERPMPVDQARRRFITVAAGASVASVGTLAVAAMPAACAVDPIYAAIERHKACALKHAAAWRVRGRFNDCQMNDEQERQLQILEDATDAAWQPCEAAGIDLINTAPTTRAGIAAAIRYAQAQHRNDGEHMPRGEFETDDGADRVDWLDCFLDTITDAVAALWLDQEAQS